MMIKRKSKQDWLRAGLEMIEQEGREKLTIDGLTRRLNVTKGSFYYHFDSIGHFKTELMAYWECQDTQQPISEANRTGDPLQEMDYVMGHSASAPWRLEAVIRTWALHDDEVREAVARVDRQRMEHGIRTFEAMGYPHDQAELMMRLLYMGLVGSGLVQPPFHGEDRRRLWEKIKNTYGIGKSVSTLQ